MNTANLAIMLGIQLRTGWKTFVVWLLAVVGTMAITSFSMADTYDTEAKIVGYASSIGSGPAIKMMNGEIAGLASLGGITANEFGFIASFVLPIMGIALVSRATRREEEAGRLELLLAATIGRHAPLVAALLWATAVSLLTGVGCWAMMAAAGIEGSGPGWYGAGLGMLVLVFSAATALVAQVVESNRGVWTISLLLALASYLVRGLGAVNDQWYIWLSPHGLLDEIRAFDEPRIWPVLVSGGLALVLSAAALLLNARRDLGAALVAARPGRPRAGAVLRAGWGATLYEHRGAILGWTLAGAALMAIYGSLTSSILDALETNPDLQLYVEAGLASVMAMFMLMAAMVAAAAGIAMAGALRTAETSGRLELLLAAPRSRTGWLLRHLLVVSLGALLVLVGGGVVLAASAAASLGDDRLWSGVMRAVAVQAPVVLAFSGTAVLLFASWPRLRGWLWAVLGVSLFIAFVGSALRLPAWLVDNSPFMVVGQVPSEPAARAGVAVMAGIALLTHMLAPVLFRHRNLPAL